MAANVAILTLHATSIVEKKRQSHNQVAGNTDQNTRCGEVPKPVSKMSKLLSSDGAKLKETQDGNGVDAGAKVREKLIILLLSLTTAEVVAE